MGYSTSDKVKNHTSEKHCRDICIHTIIHPRRKYCIQPPCLVWFVWHVAVIFCHFNIECKRGLRSMIFFDELVILERDSRHFLSCYFFRCPHLIRHQTVCGCRVYVNFLFKQFDVRKYFRNEYRTKLNNATNMQLFDINLFRHNGLENFYKNLPYIKK